MQEHSSSELYARRSPHLVDKDVVGPLADANFVVAVRCLPLLVERHHHHRGTVCLNDARVAPELVLAHLSHRPIKRGPRSQRVFNISSQGKGDLRVCELATPDALETDTEVAASSRRVTATQEGPDAFDYLAVHLRPCADNGGVARNLHSTQATAISGDQNAQDLASAFREKNK